MLQFFRKYQKFFFLFVTIIVVTTFLFFGTYQAIAPSFRKDAESEPYVTQMCRFLDTENWMMSRKIFTVNFLNDGVISKEFLETGIGALVAQKFTDHFQEEFAVCHAQEKSYSPYVHPYLPSLSAEMLWSVFAPDMAVKFKLLQEGNGGFQDRNALFLAQKQFPPAFFTQVLRYQEQNNPRTQADPRLAKDDVALFGYESLSDWYGKKYVETVAGLIIQTAKTARKLGYKVSKGEVRAELLARSQETFAELKGKIALPVSDSSGFMQLYLNQIGMTEATATKIWEDVILFRRLMHEVGDAALVDTLPLSQFYAYAYENALIELFQMPPECRLKSLTELEQLEAYLAAVGKPDHSLNKSALAIAQDYDALETVATRAPELVGKRYTLYYAHTSKKALQAKVSVKETVEWECDPNNWAQIKRQFPELAQKTGAAFDILEKMEPKGRKLVDAFARKHIVDAHPEWIQEALVAREMSEKELFLSSNPSQKTFEGIADANRFGAMLEVQNELIGYSQDQNNYYRFLVQHKTEQKEILTFKEALKSGVLSALVEKMEAKKLVQAVTQACPEAFQEIPFAYRFAPFVAAQLGHLPLGTLAEQFAVEKKEKTITRCEKDFISLEDVLVLNAGQCSDVLVDPVEGAFLYRFVEKRQDKTLPVEKLLEAQALLSKEARCKYFETLMR